MNNNFYGNKEDIIKCLNARLTGNGMQEANQYFSQIEVTYISFCNSYILINSKIYQIYKFFVKYFSS